LELIFISRQKAPLPGDALTGTPISSRIFVRKPIVAVLADQAKIDALRAQGISWTKVAEHFAESRKKNFTREQADAWCKNGFAILVGRGERQRLLITANLEAFTRLRGLSAKVDKYVAMNQKEEWIGPYLRGQFLKPERSF
jgi:hypothetical protein